MSKAKVLIADNYTVSAMILPQLLNHWGFSTCAQVASGKEAIKKAKQERPNIVLIDMNLNGDINGIETAKFIRSRLGIPIIFTTAYSDDVTRKAAFEAGPSGYFVKPFDFYVLRSTIESVINGCAAGRIRNSKKQPCLC